ncbi:DUF6398 domain-containing protein [Clostridium sp.]|uniref:DUF6398 domain-containing protein n=1 Tax=Clostridium sp. TaxID=1506 RepID=UPI0026023ABE|nr:DUF6398 domain-containing protein [Clostridium sp.]
MNSLNNKRAEDIMKIIKNITNKGIIEEIYISLSEKLIEDLCKIDTNLFNKGKAKSWACGIIHTLGLLNGLFDRKNKNYIMVSKIYETFEVSNSTGLSKSKDIRKIIDIYNERYINNKENLNKLKIDGQTISNCDTNEISEINKVNKINLDELNVKENILNKVKLNVDLKKANELCDIAWKERNYNKRIRIAKEALLISKNCAEAYIILSYDNSISNNDKKEYILKAIEISENIIGKENIYKYKNQFLKEDFTRTYYSSKYRLGNLLWENGEGNEAIDVFIYLINIYPEDSTLIRLTLMSWMIIKERFNELEELFKRYKDDFLAGTKYSKALYYFINNDKDKALRNLRIANANNPYIMEHLLKVKKVNMKEMEFNTLGSEGEAINYLRFGEEAWNSFENSKRWIKEIKYEL